MSLVEQLLSDPGKVGVVILLLTAVTLLIRGTIVPRIHVRKVETQLERSVANSEQQGEIIASLTASVERLSDSVDRCTCHSNRNRAGGGGR